MLKKLSTDTINTILIIGVILLVVEIVFFNGGLVFSVLFSGVLMYIGWKNYRPLWRKVLFWIGLISLIFTILSMIAVRFLVIAMIIVFLLHYFKTRENPDRIRPEIMDNYQEMPDQDPVLKQKFFGDESTPNKSYEWKDINIHGGIGNRIVDLSQTVLPHDEAVISIRHFVGNLTVYIPYEVEVSIHHSALIGRASIFQYKKSKVLNQVLSYQTGGYRSEKPRVKIITSMVSGDLEVKRI
ncbi:lia operon protein LiaF [Halobacillus karajensis]|uniref:Membrane protein n=1 Tax=Halobacillus karajensis TaxID=195088 RepID=A0A024P4A8_9BACI|nr:cell wall-active antibiotics response protein LiaF [Halobacillus karajensis]CDQ18690.1 putative membrane protein [Halobacillus karajensis]CDQ23238.1 putative membrane protein [Halobacillus karajensis]CDQ26720.1 putative membrane protein [Halobacillus karajensis]SEH48084.1 lia operon protein LiaF [Halobacillus karajensis]